MKTYYTPTPTQLYIFDRFLAALDNSPSHFVRRYWENGDYCINIREDKGNDVTLYMDSRTSHVEAVQHLEDGPAIAINPELDNIVRLMGDVPESPEPYKGY